MPSVEVRSFTVFKKRLYGATWHGQCGMGNVAWATWYGRWAMGNTSIEG